MGCFKKMLGAVIVILIIIIFFAINSKENTSNNDNVVSESLVESISNKIIRFHIRANDDTDKAQKLKLYVKNDVVTYIEEITKNVDDIDTVRDILSNNLENIKNIANNSIISYYGNDNYMEDVSVYIDREYFPVKIYNDYIFPQGEYEALVVNIGEGKGKNWWCVLYPPLCYADAVSSLETQDKADTVLRDTLTIDEYEAISGKKKDTKIKIHFKYLSFLNDLFAIY